MDLTLDGSNTIPLILTDGQVHMGEGSPLGQGTSSMQDSQLWEWSRVKSSGAYDFLHSMSHTPRYAYAEISCHLSCWSSSTEQPKDLHVATSHGIRLTEDQDLLLVAAPQLPDWDLSLNRLLDAVILTLREDTRN